MKMGKKNNAGKASPNNKKNKSKHKEMFNELETLEQQKLNKVRQKQSNKSHRYQEIIPEDSEDLSADPGPGNYQQLCENINRLFAKNKVNVKNAFDVPIVDLEKLSQFKSSGDDQFAWKRLSATLENDYKIYAYRVDAAHQSTFRILNTMARHEEKEQKQQMKQKEAQQNDEDLLQRIGNYKINPNAEGKYLEKNRKSINIESVEYKFDFDPIYERNKRNFDQSGLKGLLLGNLSIDENLQLPLININQEKQQQQQQNPSYHRKVKETYVPPNEEFKRMGDPSMIFKKIDHAKCHLIQYFRQSANTYPDLDEMWDKLENGLFADVREPMIKVEMLNRENDFHFNEGTYEEMDIENSDRKDNELELNNQPISNAITLKPKKLVTPNDVMEEEKYWMGDDANIKKLLGIGGGQTKRKVMTKIEKNEEYIDFNFSLVESRSEILKREVEKKEQHQQIEDKFLLPTNLFSDFRVQQPYTLRKIETETVAEDIDIMDEEQKVLEVIEAEEFKQQTRRQQTSIRETKEQLKSFLSTNESGNTSFRDIYQTQEQKCEAQVSPALCFLTLLHLANENNLKFVQKNEENFIVEGN